MKLPVFIFLLLASTQASKECALFGDEVPLSLDALEKHIKMFDPNNDGIITPAEMEAGAKELGVSDPVFVRRLGIFGLSLIDNLAANGFFRTLVGLISGQITTNKPIRVEDAMNAVHTGTVGFFKCRPTNKQISSVFNKYKNPTTNTLDKDGIKLMLADAAKRDEMSKKIGFVPWLLKLLGNIATDGEWSALSGVLKDDKGMMTLQQFKNLFKGDLRELNNPNLLDGKLPAISSKSLEIKPQPQCLTRLWCSTQPGRQKDFARQFNRTCKQRFNSGR